MLCARLEAAVNGEELSCKEFLLVAGPRAVGEEEALHRRTLKTIHRKIK
jgi:hypothetical protein